MDVDEHFMKLALKEAKKGWGLTSPNPMVGAVLIRNSIVLGKGYHRVGLPHAERMQSQAPTEIPAMPPYTALEPCSTCEELTLHQGDHRRQHQRVVIGCLDQIQSFLGNQHPQNNGIQVKRRPRKECGALNGHSSIGYYGKTIRQT